MQINSLPPLSGPTSGPPSAVLSASKSVSVLVSVLRSLRSLGTVSALLIAACLGLAGGAAWANPSGYSVVNGQATFARQGDVFSITNSPNTIINWSSFSIRSGEVTQFIQQNSSSSVLNRITGQNPSLILGALKSNGRVFLVNPNGILFGANSQVNVSGLVASSLAISNTDFLAGKNTFAAGSLAGDVTNRGAITTPSGGQVFLIAPNVSNTGIIASPEGEVLLAAGRSVQLADSTNPSVHIVVSAPTDQAINLGQVITQGGEIGIYGALVNQRGVLNANSAVLGENGKIVLRASHTTLLEAGSVTTATGVDSGGEIQALGQQVGLMGNASIDASGQNHGGTVLIGGDYQGKNATVMDAQQVYVDQAATVSADAIVRGSGGKVIVWGEQTARVYGKISVRGGAQSGDGGFVETSGGFLDVAGLRVDAAAAHGQYGKWLLDPYDIIVSQGNDEFPLSNVAAFVNNSAGTSIINASQISNSTADVILQALHDINFNSTINIVAAGVGLTAQAGNDINVNASIFTNGGALTLSPNDNSGGSASGVGKITISSDYALITNGGALNLGRPSLSSCIANPAIAGCASVLPTLASCAANPASEGCSVVLPSIATCIANPSTPGCSFVLPSLATCSASPTAVGCSAVLPSIASCVANPASMGCSIVLPTLATCTAIPTAAGCVAVLPSLAQCASTPTLQGCSAVLPSVSLCIANPAIAGCAVVLPPVMSAASGNSPITQSLNATVNIINTASVNTLPSVTFDTSMPPTSAAPKADTKINSTVPPDSGAPNDLSVAKKMYCN